MRILVCGGRNYTDGESVAWALSQFAGPHNVVLINGGASGADALGRLYAQRLGWEVLTFGADWHMHGKAAGPMRNQRMLDLGKPDVVLAFPGGRGTADMVKKAKKAGIRVVVVP